MKVITTILASLAGAGAVRVVSDNGARDKCERKAPEVIAAIDQYCVKLGEKNMIPNPEAKKGLISTHKGKHATVLMHGSCKPAQWVPREYCFKQFYQICADGNSQGEGQASYGNDKCQNWVIAHGKVPAGKAGKNGKEKDDDDDDDVQHKNGKKGKNGKDGKTGKNGKNGKNGKDNEGRIGKGKVGTTANRDRDKRNDD